MFKKKLAEESDIKPVDGKCPEGMIISEDGSKCLVQKTEESVKESDFQIGSKDPQFVIDGPLRIRIESNKLVEFADGEPVELVENAVGNLQIGISENVIEISDEKMAMAFLETVTHKDDVRVEDKEVTVAEAIKSNMDPLKVATMIMEQHGKEAGSLSKLREGNSILRVNVRRKIRSMRNVAMKAAAVRKENAKNSSFILHKALEIVK